MATSREQSAANTPKLTFIIPSHEGRITCAAWLPGDRIVTGLWDKTVRIWNLTDGTQEGTSMIHDHEVQDIVATKDGRIVSCCEEDEHLTVWNADTQAVMERPLARSNQDYGIPGRLTLSQNEELLASYHRGGFIFWEVAGTVRDRGHIRFDEEPDVSARAACLSPNGSRLAVSCEGGGLSLFDVETGERIFVSRIDPWPYTISWSLDGHRLFCGNEKGQIHCLNSNTGESVGKPWTGHTKYVSCTSLSPDGKWLASGSDDRSVRFWDAESGKPVGEPLTHRALVHTVAFSCSGKFLLSIFFSFSSPLFIWRLPWWDDPNQKTPSALLDTSAVVPTGTSGPSNIPNLGLLDASPPRRPLHPRTHSRGNSSTGPQRVQDSGRSWGWWKRIPGLVLLRSYSIHTGYAPPRTAVASSSTVNNNQRTQSLSRPEENSEGSSDTLAAGPEPEVGEAGCCGFLSPRQPRAIAAQGRRDVRGERSSRSDHRPPNNTRNAGTPPAIPASTHPAAQDILELSAVVRSPDAT